MLPWRRDEEPTCDEEPTYDEVSEYGGEDEPMFAKELIFDGKPLFAEEHEEDEWSMFDNKSNFDEGPIFDQELEYDADQDVTLKKLEILEEHRFDEESIGNIERKSWSVEEPTKDTMPLVFSVANKKLTVTTDEAHVVLFVSLFETPILDIQHVKDLFPKTIILHKSYYWMSTKEHG